MRDPKIEIGPDELAWDGNWIQCWRRPFRSKKTGVPGIWEIIKRKRPINVVSVAPVTADGKLILTKIFRIPSAGWIIDLCAGLTDGPEEKFEDAARREMLEELGYAAETLELACCGSYNPGLWNDDIAIFIGWNAKKIQEPQLEDSEDIEAVEVPIATAREFLKKESGDAKIDVKVWSALYFIESIMKERTGK